MVRNGKEVDLTSLDFLKLPLRYGTEHCYITLSDHCFTADIVALRNNPTLGKYIHYTELSEEEHERWLLGQLERDDSLNFALVANQAFAGTLSLYNIQHGRSCEFGRMMMPDDGRRIYALAAEMLGMSFAFEILGIETLYCAVMEGNHSVLNFHLKNGWTRDPRFDSNVTIHGLNAPLLGLSVRRSDWPGCFAKMRPLAKRLFVLAPKRSVYPLG